MDPNATLAELLEYASAVMNDEAEDYRPDNLPYDAVQMAALVLALHTWLSEGGFLPAAWSPRPPSSASRDRGYR